MPTITLTDPTTLTTVASGLIATNNANLRALLNSGLDPVNLKGNPALVSGEFPVWNGTVFVRSSTLPPSGIGVAAGIIEMYGGAAAPTGYVLCDGASYVRTGGTYDALFAAIGTAFGNVDGTHFNVPDLQGRVPVGKGTNASVNALNANDGQIVANRRPHHRTSITDPGHRHNLRKASDSTASTQAENAPSGTPTLSDPTAIDINTTGITVGSGNANDALDTPSFIVVNYIIKL